MCKFKKKNTTTPSQRHLVQVSTKHLIKKPIIKSKIKGLKNFAGRNHSGKITIHHKGSGHKKKYRYIKFCRNEPEIGIVTSLEYDPYRNANIASVFDISSKHFFYILAPKSLETGDIVKSGKDIEPKLGCSLPISEISTENYIHNISIIENKPAQATRSAGTFSMILEKTKEKATIELSSGKQKSVSANCFATIGEISNELFLFFQKGKAGRNRWLNNRPTTRGVAMNPIDHPHGGGEGKKSGKGKNSLG